MQPSLDAGDYVIVNRWAYLVRPPVVGDVVILRNPQDDRILVKRIVGTDAAGLFIVRGDNASESTDSRVFGAVPKERILGKVVLKIGP